MSSLLTLHRHPVIGFNSSILLKQTDRQTAEQSSCFSTSHVDQWMHADNAFKLIGCIPIISITIGIFRLYRTYLVSQIVLHGERQIDRDWIVKKEIVLAVAEIFQASILLLGLHLIVTIFDHAAVLITYCCSEDYSSIYISEYNENILKSQFESKFDNEVL